MKFYFLNVGYFSRRPPGPSVWCVDDHQPLQDNAPKEVTLLDRAGQQSGLGRWPGLKDKLKEVFGDMFWPSYTPHVNHTCDVCTKPFTFAGAALEIQAAAIDGIQGTKWAKCATVGCDEPLPTLKRCERYTPRGASWPLVS